MSSALNGPGIAQAPSRAQLVLRCAALLLVGGCALAVLLELPGGILKRNVAPADLPWTDYGIRKLTVDPDGTWRIVRSGYVDRMRRMVITPAGQLETYRDDNMSEAQQDASGGFDVVERTTDRGSVISVRPPRAYYQWRKNLREGGDRLQLNPLPDRRTDSSAQPGMQATLKNLAPRIDKHDEPTFHQADIPPAPDTGVRIQLNQHDQLAFLDLLPGHWYYPDVADCAAYHDGQLWLTTDRQRNLFRLRVEEPEHGPPTVTIEQAAPLSLPDSSDRDCRLGLDPQHGELFLLRADGRRFWFDPQTLAPTGQDKLPGLWDAEYAEFDLRPGTHNGWLGLPLSRQVYDRIMRGAMVVFLACLLGLSLVWRPQWKSTSALTTADSNSSADSEHT